MSGPQKWWFDDPYSLTSGDSSPEVFRLNHNGHSVASFSVANFGSEQACIEAAWRYAYETDVDEVRAAADALAMVLEDQIKRTPFSPAANGISVHLSLEQLQTQREALKAYREATQ